jgi:hypothetical protein
MKTYRYGNRGNFIRIGRTTLHGRIGKNFFSVGFGAYGPYALGRLNVNRRVGVKASVGTLGLMGGADTRITSHTRLGAGYNATRRKLYAELKYKKNKIRF